MLLVPYSVEAAAGELPRHGTPVVWTWLSLVSALFVLERVVVLDHQLSLGWFPDGLFIGVTFIVASWSLYGDPVLFDVWQLWSHLLIHPHWWSLVVEIVLMLVIGRALERLLGTALFLAALGCLGPLGGVLLVLVGQQAMHTGAWPLMAGLIGLTAGRLPGATIRWALVWWVIVAVGRWPWFHMSLHTLLVLLLTLVLALMPLASALPTLLASVAVAAMGFGLGRLIRRRAADGPDGSEEARTPP